MGDELRKTEQLIPDENWYLSQGRKRHLSGHCPLASPDKCPKYYVSLKLLGKDFLQISDRRQVELEHKWETSDCFANTDSWPSISYPSDHCPSKGYQQICPEITGRFEGMYAIELRPYADEFDKKIAHKKLVETKAIKDDPRWKWNSCVPLHYLDCREFSVHGFGKLLAEKKIKKRRSETEISSKLRWDIFYRDKFTSQYCGVTGVGVELVIDHVISLADGGSADPNNLKTACIPCNGGKGRRSLGA